MKDLNTKLSTLWLFATLNYLYADVVTLMDPVKNTHSYEIVRPG
jgi:hypothetical protein